MTILEENSKLLVESIKDLYLKGKYELEYAIVQLNKFYANGRITKTDFEEQCEYYKSEKERLNSAEVIEDEKIIEQLEEVKNNITEDNFMTLDTVENDTVDDQVQEKEIENQEVEESAE